MSELAQMTLNLDGDSREDEYVTPYSDSLKTHLIKNGGKSRCNPIYILV